MSTIDRDGLFALALIVDSVDIATRQRVLPNHKPYSRVIELSTLEHLQHIMQNKTSKIIIGHQILSSI
jgi:hypothetical protein